MDDTTRQSLDLLARKMKQEPPMLFTGAGFSYGAKNAKGRKLPLGMGLKEMFATDLLCLEKTDSDYEEFMSMTLSEAYSEVRSCGADRAAGYLRDLFSECVPESYHKTIAAYPWRKIYTLNIDDLMEEAVPKWRLNIINSHRPCPEKPNRIDYVKLHGCVRNYSEGFVFSQEEYSRVSIADKRYADLVYDLALYDFVFIGANASEPDINFALSQYTGAAESRRGGIFYVDPKPGMSLRRKIRESGAHLIQLTCEEFAQWLAGQTPVKGRVSKSAIGNRQFDRVFRRLSLLYDKQGELDNSRTQLYEGFTPTWRDIFADYDFRVPEVDRICNDIITILSQGGDEPIVAAVTGKAVGGKSTLLLRVGMTMMKQGFEVVEYIGQRFDKKLFIQYAPAIDDTVILLVDNGVKHYRAISEILEEYPEGKRIVVVTVDRPFYHQKKHYELSHFPGYREYDLDKAMSVDMAAIARSAVETLDRKHLLGRLLRESDEERVKHFVRSRDLADALWRLNHGEHFERRLAESYRELVDEKADDTGAEDMAQVLYVLAVFNIADLEYVPHTLLQIWKARRYASRIEPRLSDFVKPVYNQGIALRSEVMKDLIMNSQVLTSKGRIAIIKELFVHLRSFLSDAGSYWNAIQSRVMNVNFLHHDLKISYTNIKRLLVGLSDAYADDPYYLIQLGLIEQRLGDYSLAYNHLNQALSLSPSYNAQNALARNYLRQATRDNSITKDRALVLYQEGRRRMEILIEEREQYQVRAYSVHSLIVESVSLWEKYSSIEPSADELKCLLNYMQLVLDKREPDRRMSHAGAKLWNYIERRKLTKRLPDFSKDDLRLLSAMLSDASDEEFDDDL